MWDPQFERLAGTYRVVRYDMRGHGRSSGLGEPGTTHSQSADLAALLSFLQLERVHVIGLSMGGYVAYEFALEHPGRARSLTLIDPAWRFDWSHMGAFQSRLVTYIGAGLEAGLRAWIEDPLFVPARRIPALKRQLDEMICVGHRAAGTGALFTNPASAASPSPRAETRLAAIAVPTLVIVGDLDDPEFVQHADFVAHNVPGAKKIVVAGAGHLSSMEKPEEVNSALLDFLAAARTLAA
jgi:pimeloyl-ACP methyl ester carboxylesterase